MAKRFIVENKDIKNIDEEKFEIAGKEVKHIQVLRYNIGDEININEYICKVEKMTRDTITLKKLGYVKKNGEPNIDLNLYVALLKNEKLDYVVQKATELGIKNITLFTSKNVIVKLDKKAMEKRVEKLQKIANEACKQCNRTDIVKVNEVISFNELLDSMKNHELNIFAYEKESKKLKEVIIQKENMSIKNISCIVGPEGGFDYMESKLLKDLENTFSISLGERILRADTAAVSLISILMYEFDK